MLCTKRIQHIVKENLKTKTYIPNERTEEKKKKWTLMKQKQEIFSNKEFKIIINGLNVIRTMHEQSDKCKGKTI